jgi:monoterpene epsilon-lactone hydrolase
MPESMRFKFSGRFRIKLQVLSIFIWSSLYVLTRRLLRGPLLPSWSLLFEASTFYQKALFRAAYRFPDIKDGRELMDALVLQEPSLDKVRLEPVTSPIKGDWYRPETLKAERVILYCHGAYAFYAGSEKVFVAELAVTTGMPVLALDYRLTPEYPFPAQLEDAAACYDWLLECGYEAEDIIVMGTSAGGNLCLSLIQKLRDSERALPVLAVALCPWTDISNSGESIDKNDPYDTLDRGMLEKGARWYTGEHDPQDPMISPLYADLRGLPPIYLQAGERESFIDMIRAYYERAKAQGADITLDVWEGMNHVFQGYGDLVSESKDAMARITTVVQEK